MKTFWLSASIVFLAVLPVKAQVASDNASNYASWISGSNGGTGFGAWNLYTSGNGSTGFFRASSVGDGFGNTDTSGNSFGMFGNPAGLTYANAERSLSTALAIGNSFSINLAIAFRNGNKGISLFNGGGFSSEVWNFNVGGDTYSAGGAGQSWAYSQTSVFSLTATQTSATNLFVQLQRGSDLYTSNVTVGSALTGFRLYVGSTDDGNALNNLYFNNLSVVPEPSTGALLLGGMVVLAGLRCSLNRSRSSS
ncbi:MAG: PEP-CTERM sorting domain-containing protein [Candidatus Methylacidiphilales bacterium]|nr:PEP-CTERM sorting domain-containing protein [Candidatus Methylacidiphilales bacterium]